MSFTKYQYKRFKNVFVFKKYVKHQYLSNLYFIIVSSFNIIYLFFVVNILILITIFFILFCSWIYKMLYYLCIIYYRYIIEFFYVLFLSNDKNCAPAQV